MASSSSAESPLRAELESGILTLTMDQPERRNAIDPELRDALKEALGEADADGRSSMLADSLAQTALLASADHREGLAAVRERRDPSSPAADGQTSSSDGVGPTIGEGVYLAPTAVLIGDVQIGDYATVWFRDGPPWGLQPDRDRRALVDPGQRRDSIARSTCRPSSAKR